MSIDPPAHQGNGHPIAPVQSAFLTAVQLLEAQRATLLLRDPVEPVLIVAASVGLDDRIAPQVRVPIGQGIAGMVVERGVSLFGEFDDGTFLSVPVMTDQGAEGALNVTQRAKGKRYRTEDIPLAASAAQHIGHLMEYGRTATRDPVSGLPNRRAFEEVLERELALGARTGNAFSLVFLDLDNLKTINDRYGHPKGDEVLRGIGASLQRILRPYDFAGRLGGDEFVLLLSGTNESDSGIAERIGNAMGQLSTELGLTISTSVGVARYPKDASGGSELVAIADGRMYEDKRARKLFLSMNAPGADVR